MMYSSHHGLPETIVTDDGSQFTSHRIQQYCSQNAIKHMFSPPYHPQSNGQAERFVDTLKEALLEAEGEGTPFDVIQKVLMVYRTTANESTPNKQSPAEVLYERKLRTIYSFMLPPAPRRDDASLRNKRKFDVGDAVYARDNRAGH
uniref:Integrase catalytic domain-containing protein n=1 Tax=Trichobilharzia regenti TaxID=157069 RepID=A0AA85J5P6_TRIRE|nr:unnamed protein product [Trichobilharzia regenti]